MCLFRFYTYKCYNNIRSTIGPINIMRWLILFVSIIFIKNTWNKYGTPFVFYSILKCKTYYELSIAITPHRYLFCHITCSLGDEASQKLIQRVNNLCTSLVSMYVPIHIADSVSTWTHQTHSTVYVTHLSNN